MDRIERKAELAYPVERVWRALSDAQEFGAWFRVGLTEPFRVGAEAAGPITWPGMGHVTWRATIVALDAKRRFAFRWHPYAIDPAVDYSAEATTLVEFALEATEGGTRLTLTETGFDALPEARREEAYSRHEGGWTVQMGNIAAWLGEKA